MKNAHRYKRAFGAAIEQYKASKENRKILEESEEAEPFQYSSSVGVPTQQEDEKEPAVKETVSNPEESQAEAAKGLAVALAKFSEQVTNEERPDPDTELENARRKMAAAMRIVEDGGISRALCSSLLPEVLSWGDGIAGTDSQDNLAFEATEIKVKVHERQPGGGRTNVRFAFGGRQFRVVHEDTGIAYGGGSIHGTIDLHVDHHLVLAMNIARRERDEFGFGPWECWRVTALDVGDWMQALLRILAKIKSHKQREGSIFDDAALEAAARINLPDDTDNV